jgi:hypothetical protein
VDRQLGEDAASDRSEGLGDVEGVAQPLSNAAGEQGQDSSTRRPRQVPAPSGSALRQVSDQRRRPGGHKGRGQQSAASGSSLSPHERALRAEYAKPVPEIRRTPRLQGAQKPPRPLPDVVETASPDLPTGYSTSAGYFTGGE